MLNYNGIRWSYELPDCSMPIALDTYSRCSFNCLYCFSFFKPKFASKVKEVRGINVKKLADLFNGRTYKEVFSPFIKQRKIIQWGGITDPFDNFEKKYRLTYQLLCELKKINYPLCFSTKSVWWTKDKEYIKLFNNQKNWYVKFSIINYDSEISKFIEQGTPTPAERLEAIRAVSNMKCGYPILRLRPFIIGMSDRNDEYLELINKAHKNGAKAISTEFLCLENRISYKRNERFRGIRDMVGYDILNFYRQNSIAEGYLRLNRELKRPYIEKMKKLCDKLKMGFYVSDAHYKNMCKNGSCCGLPNEENYFRSQFTEMIVIAKVKGRITFDDFLSVMPKEYNTIDYTSLEGINMQCRKNVAIRHGQKVKDWFREKWNDIKSNSGLYRAYARVLTPVGVEKGNIVYEYKKEH